MTVIEFSTPLTDNQSSVGEWATKRLSVPNIRFMAGSLTDWGREIIELAIVSPSEEVLYHSRFCPIEPIHHDQTAKHGLTADMLVNEPTWAEEWPKIKKLLDGLPTLAYQRQGYDVVMYDARLSEQCIRTTCELHGIEPPPYSWLPGSKWFIGQHARWRGQVRSRRYAMQPLPQFDDLVRHSALGDAIATLRTVQQMSAAYLEEQKKLANGEKIYMKHFVFVTDTFWEVISNEQYREAVHEFRAKYPTAKIVHRATATAEQVAQGRGLIE